MQILTGASKSVYISEYMHVPALRHTPTPTHTHVHTHTPYHCFDILPSLRHSFFFMLCCVLGLFNEVIVVLLLVKRCYLIMWKNFHLETTKQALHKKISPLCCISCCLKKQKKTVYLSFSFSFSSSLRYFIRKWIRKIYLALSRTSHSSFEDVECRTFLLFLQKIPAAFIMFFVWKVVSYIISWDTYLI